MMKGQLPLNPLWTLLVFGAVSPKAAIFAAYERSPWQVVESLKEGRARG